MSGIPEDLEFPVDRTELEQLLEQFNTEIAGLQSRLTVLMSAADGVRALLGMAPAAVEWTSMVGSDADHAAEAASVGEAQRVTPVPQRRTEGPPRGKRAAQLILQSDTSRFWSVREVWDEQVRRRWAEPRPRGARGNPPSRIALQRLQDDYPQNVEVTHSPVMAYKWISQPSPSLNGSGASHAEEVSP